MRPFDPELPCPPTTGVKPGIDYTLARMDCLIAWYARESRRDSVSHKLLRIVSITVAALITVLAAAHTDPVWIALAGGVIVVSQGIDELFQFQADWVKNAASKEELKRERALYLATAGPYAPGVTTDPDRLLARRVEDVASRELASWVQLQPPDQGATPAGSSTDARVAKDDA